MYEVFSKHHTRHLCGLCEVFSKHHVIIPVENLHCTSCMHTIERVLHALTPAPTDIDISIPSKSVSLFITHGLTLPRIHAALDDAGFDLASAPLPRTKISKHVHQCSLCQSTAPKNPDDAPHKLTLSIGGMTCSSCAATVSDMLSSLPGISDVAVSLLTNSATLLVETKSLIPTITDMIEGCGFEPELISAEPNLSHLPPGPAPRTISLRINGMFCQRCPGKVMDALNNIAPRVAVMKPITDHTNPIIEISYEPVPPDFTIRTIISCIISADPAFTVSPHHPPTIEQRTRTMQFLELSALSRRLLFTFIIAIPTFIIGIVYMSLVPSDNPSKKYLMEPMWGGNASRIQWSTFFLATPVMFYSALLFHRRSIKDIVSIWRRGSSTPMISRFTKFGSMNLLVSTGVSIAYFASIILLAMAASQIPASDQIGDTTTYFDSVVFLTLLLLCGRYAEAYSKARTADAITALGSLRPTEALLVTPRSPSDKTSYSGSNKDDLERGNPLLDGDWSIVSRSKTERVPVDLLEVGDTVRVLNGATPPSDGTIITGAETSFDESSLTGEARPIKKLVGDRVFLGTINKARPVDVRVDAVGGVTMLDHIIRIVREGQARRAPIERIADVVTSVFVPTITLLAMITWLVWLCLGLGRWIPHDYLDIDVGGWPVWSLEFAMSMFVIACPCGIGLAAPTALLVGAGLAAKHGILARGGGEAFQEMAQVDVIVFDKTGTLTEGHPQVSDFEAIPGATWTRQTILGIAAELESGSAHPLGIAIREYAAMHGAAQLNAIGFDEAPGYGVKAYFDALRCMALIGNKAWMKEHGATVGDHITSWLDQRTAESKSIVLLAIKDDSAESFSLVAMFAVADPLRPEAPGVIRSLRDKGIETWMISGDNEVTAKAVAKSAGILDINVLANVLPQQKAEKVAWLQANGPKRRTGLVAWWRISGKKKMNTKRCIVSMVGDGINDAPALATSDIGVAIGSGSDVVVSSASFILLSSNLESFLTLCDLSRTVFHRVKLNFVWAFVYNIIAVPIAAGVLYPVGHTRLAPVWASLSMALSSVSVVCSSLLLKLYRAPKAQST